MKRLMVRLLIVAALMLSLVRFAGAGTPTGFLNKTIKMGDHTYKYVLYIPADYTPKVKLPVILFLHGSGERGADGLKQSEVGIGRAIRLHPERYPALAVIPQCVEDKFWSAEMADFALKALDDTVKQYKGDASRLYLTGLSMGGFGSWDIASAHPDKFAAAVICCGGGDPAKVASKVKNLPIWVFHGEKDGAVNVEQSRKMVQAITDAGGSTIKYTEYPGVDHNCWDNAYGDKEMTDWLFVQKKK